MDLPTANYITYKSILFNLQTHGRNNYFSHHEIEPILLNRWPLTVKLHWLLICINLVWLAIQSPTLKLLATRRTNNDEKCSRLKCAFRNCLLLRYTPTVKLCLRWKKQIDIVFLFSYFKCAINKTCRTPIRTHFRQFDSRIMFPLHKREHVMHFVVWLCVFWEWFHYYILKCVYTLYQSDYYSCY